MKYPPRWEKGSGTFKFRLRCLTFSGSKLEEDDGEVDRFWTEKENDWKQKKSQHVMFDWDRSVRPKLETFTLFYVINIPWASMWGSSSRLGRSTEDFSFLFDSNGNRRLLVWTYRGGIEKVNQTKVAREKEEGIFSWRCWWMFGISFSPWNCFSCRARIQELPHFFHLYVEVDEWIE